jgi:capsular polysaccharide biosynthesis protein
MAEQVDLRSVRSLVRRRRRLLALLALTGAVLGVAFVVWRPPLYTSTSRVLLPAGPVLPNGEQTSWEASTQVSIARSDAVLGPAAQAVSPPLSRREIRRLVDVSAPTADVLVLEARGPSSKAAERLAQAVAEATVDYQAEATSSLSSAELAQLTTRRESLQGTLDTVDEQVERTEERIATADPNSLIARQDNSALAQLTAQQTDLVLEINELQNRIDGSAGNLSARIIESATPADRPLLPVWYVLAALGGAVVAALVGLLALLVLTRRDFKLGTRDEIADTVGSPVLASVRVSTPRTVASWRSLLESYAPSAAEGWALRQALAHVGLGELVMRGPGPRDDDAPTGRHLLCVASLEDDARALSVGPQIASYAASIGISTLLVPQQEDSLAQLWAACSSHPDDEDVRPGLRVASRRRTKRLPELTVLVTALDRRAPQMPRLDRSAVVLLAVSARGATSEDLARAAVAAYESGFRVGGVLVADPDPLDHTTGRLLPHERLQEPNLPSRVTGPRPADWREPPRTGSAT